MDSALLLNALWIVAITVIAWAVLKADSER